MIHINKLKSPLIILCSMTIVGLSVNRLFSANSLLEYLIGYFAIFLFGAFSLYLIFENKLKTVSFFNPLRQFINNNLLVLDYFGIILGLTLLEILFLSYTPDNLLMNGSRLFLIALFGVGIVILLIQIVRIKRS